MERGRGLLAALRWRRRADAGQLVQADLRGTAGEGVRLRLRVGPAGRDADGDAAGRPRRGHEVHGRSSCPSCACSRWRLPSGWSSLARDGATLLLVGRAYRRGRRVPSARRAPSGVPATRLAVLLDERRQRHPGSAHRQRPGTGRRHRRGVAGPRRCRPGDDGGLGASVHAEDRRRCARVLHREPEASEQVDGVGAARAGRTVGRVVRPAARAARCRAASRPRVRAARRCTSSWRPASRVSCGSRAPPVSGAPSPTCASSGREYRTVGAGRGD